MNTLRLTLCSLFAGLTALFSPALVRAAESYVRVAGPVAIDSRRSTPTYITRLAPGRDYIVVASGRMSYWDTAGLVDATHIIRTEFGQGPMAFPTLKFVNPNLSMLDLVTRQTGSPPAISSNNTYSARIRGSGLPLSAFVQDSPGAYVDNRGALFVTVYEVRRTPSPQPPNNGGLTSVTVSRSPVYVKLWDHGSQDGDVVQIYVNGRLYRTVQLTKGGTTLRLPLPYGRHRFQVKAMNQGRSGPNTASMSISSVSSGRSQQRWSLKTGQVATMDIQVQPGHRT